MLALVFQVGGDRVALPAEAIEEIVAMVNLCPLPGAPTGIVGDFNFHGNRVPVIDLGELDLGRVAAPRWSTRIILTRRPGDNKLIGLIAENATELVRAEPGTESAPAFSDRQGIVRWFEYSVLSEGFIGGFIDEHDSVIPTDYPRLLNASDMPTVAAPAPLPPPVAPKVR
ncbi:MAG: chemotaxis protein CheW, partial [Verrucomicrobiia bacterium]